MYTQISVYIYNIIHRRQYLIRNMDQSVKFHAWQMSCIQAADDNKHAFVLVNLNKEFRFSENFGML